MGGFLAESAESVLFSVGAISTAARTPRRSPAVVVSAEYSGDGSASAELFSLRRFPRPERRWVQVPQTPAPGSPSSWRLDSPRRQPCIGSAGSSLLGPSTTDNRLDK